MRAVCNTEAWACKRANSLSTNCMLVNCALALSDRFSYSYSLPSIVIVVIVFILSGSIRNHQIGGDIHHPRRI